MAAPADLQVELLSGHQNDLSRWPTHNDAREQEVLEALRSMESRSHMDACRCVRELETQHRERRSWIWAQLGLSPMAQLLEPLGLLAQRADQPLVGSTPQRLAGSGDGEHSPGRRGGSTVAPLAG